MIFIAEGLVMDYLENPAVTFKQKAKNILLFFLILFVWILGVNFLLGLLLGPPSSSYTLNLPTFIFTCICAPLFEEIVYRAAPLKIAKVIGDKLNITKKLILPVMLASAVIFGWDHNGGAITVLKQGMMGFVFSVVYIKNNYCYWSAVTIHFMWNLLASIA